MERPDNTKSAPAADVERGNALDRDIDPIIEARTLVDRLNATAHGQPHLAGENYSAIQHDNALLMIARVQTLLLIDIARSLRAKNDHP